MATNFPGSLDSFTNPSSSSTLDSPSHAAQHANVNDAIEAIETKLGIGAGTIGTWTSWTPTFHGLDAPTVSNATIDFQYARLNDLVFMIGSFTFGATVNVTGEIGFTTAVDCSLTNPVVGYAGDAGTGLKNLFAWIDTGFSPSRIRLWTMQTNVTYGILVGTSATVPQTWATGDLFRITAIGKVA